MNIVNARRSASRRLVVLLYGGAVTNLMRAIAAVEAGNVEKRVLELNKALAIIAQLQGTLDSKKAAPSPLNSTSFITLCVLRSWKPA